MNMTKQKAAALFIAVTTLLAANMASAGFYTPYGVYVPTCQWVTVWDPFGNWFTRWQCL